MSQKLAKDDPSVEYEPHGGTPFRRCGTCSMYSTDGLDHRCTLVRGLIQPYAVCKRFEQKGTQ